MFSLCSLADPELQRRGGHIFAEIFERTFLGVSRKNFSVSQKSFIYLPKFLMTFFLVIDIVTGGPKPLHFDEFTMLSLLPRGSNSIANFDGSAMAGFAPSRGSATVRIPMSVAKIYLGHPIAACCSEILAGISPSYARSLKSFESLSTLMLSAVLNTSYSARGASLVLNTYLVLPVQA